MFTQSISKIRNVEQIIDKYHKDFPLFSLPKEVAIIYALRVFEDFCRLPLYYKQMTREENDLLIHDNLDSLNKLIKWIFTECIESHTIVYPEKTRGKYYKWASQALINGGKYYKLCSAFTSWSRGYLEAILEEKRKKLTFIRKKIDTAHQHATDMILFERKKASRQSLAQNSLEYLKLQIEEGQNELLANTQIIDGVIKYRIAGSVWNTFETISNLQNSYMFELPEDWDFLYFSLKDLKTFWCALLTIAMIHNWICQNAGVEGLGLDSVIIVTSIDQLSKDIEKRTGMSESKIKSLIRYLTYNPNVRNVDIVWQPLVPINNDQIAISPYLILENSIERNVISLINKVEQANYSRVSSMKENIMINDLFKEFSSQYSNLKIAFNIQLPGQLPDIDFIMYDTEEKVLFIGELKWLLSVASAQEAFAREPDLKKGVAQVILIREYICSNLQDCVMRAFENNKLEVQKLFLCVISKHNIGSIIFDKDIPIISEESLRLLLKTHRGNLEKVIDDIKSGKYRPLVNEDYKVKNSQIDYGGYKFVMPSIEFIGSKEDLIGTNRSI